MMGFLVGGAEPSGMLWSGSARRTYLTAAIQGRLAVFQQSEVDEFLFQPLAAGDVQRLGDLVEQEVGEAVACPLQGLAHSRGRQRLAQRAGQLFGDLGAGQ